MRKLGTPLLAAAAITMGLTLTACSTPESGEQTTGGSLELFSTKAENVDTLQKLVDAFVADNPGVSITIQSPADAATVLRARLTTNDIPDIIAVGGDSTYTELAGADVLLDLTGQDFLSNVLSEYQQMLYDIQPDQSTTPYAIPYAANGSGVLYNKDIFADNNVSIPQTWDEFIAAANTFKDAGVNPFLLTFVDAWTTLPPWNSMAPVISPSGFIDQLLDGKAKFTGTHEEVLQKYIQILNLSTNDYMGVSYDDGNKAFAQGEAAMMINGNWAIPEFLKTNPDMNVDLFAFPTTNTASNNTITSGIDVALALGKDSKYSDIGLKFLDFMTQTANAQQYIDEQFAFSAVKGAEQNNATVAGVKDTIAAGRVSNFPDHYYPAGFDLASILSQFALNNKNGMDPTENITETLASCDTEYQALI